MSTTETVVLLWTMEEALVYAEEEPVAAAAAPAALEGASWACDVMYVFGSISGIDGGLSRSMRVGGGRGRMTTSFVSAAGRREDRRAGPALLARRYVGSVSCSGREGVEEAVSVEPSEGLSGEAGVEPSMEVAAAAPAPLAAAARVASKVEDEAEEEEEDADAEDKGAITVSSTSPGPRGPLILLEARKESYGTVARESIVMGVIEVPDMGDIAGSM